MFRTISNIFKVEELRKKLLFTFLMLLVYRIGCFIPNPRTDVSYLKQFADSSGMLGVLSSFTGGSMKNFSILALGLSPYISASIVVQLLSKGVIRRLTDWSKEGEVGQKKVKKVTYYMTAIFGFFQSYATAFGFSKMYPGLLINPSVWTFLLVALTMTIGTMLMVWLGETLTKKGIGNGISLLIFAGIVANIPSAVQSFYVSEFYNSQNTLSMNIVKGVLILVLVILMTAFTVFMQLGTRKIPIQYPTRTVGDKQYKGQTSHIPLKVNSAGMIPVIFAMGIFMVPTSLARYWQGNKIADWILANLDYTSTFGMILYVTLIIAFTYFYATMQINPNDMAENLKKNGGYIPGHRPGKDTADYITMILMRITLFGALFLAFLTIIPILFTKYTAMPQQLRIGGTALLIVVGVVYDLTKQVQTHLKEKSYRGFMN